MDAMEGYLQIQKKIEECSGCIPIENDTPIALELARAQSKDVIIDDIKNRWNSEHHTLSLCTGELAGTIFKPNVDLLQSLAQPATFGYKNETIIDEKVRKGLCLSNKEINVSDTVAEILMSKLHLLPRGKQWQPVFHKLSLYRPGDFFSEHVDTFREPGHLATAVLLLPTTFTGGELICNEQLCDLKSSAKNIAYVMFFTDVPHQVLPVNSGIRITLQYDLYMVDKEEEIIEYAQSHVMGGADLSPVKSIDLTWFNAVASSVQNERRPIALLLQHFYPCVGLRRELLKGSDWHLFQACEEYKRVLSSVILDFSDWQEGSYTVTARLLDDCGVEPHKIIFGSSKSSMPRLRAQNYIEYIGNEAQEEEAQYYASILILK